MRLKGIDQFKCVQIYSEEMPDKDIAHQRAVQQRFMDKLKPTLNTNNTSKATLNTGTRTDNTSKAKTRTDTAKLKMKTRLVNEMIEFNNDYIKRIKNKQYAKEYHKTYSPKYYKENRNRLRLAQSEYYYYNKEKLTKAKNNKNKAIRDSKKYYCKVCELACISTSALKKHKLSKKHVNREFAQ